MYQIFIPLRFPGLNEYIDAERSNRHIAAKMKKEFTAAAALYLRSAPHSTAPVDVYFTWYEKTRRRDKDNVAFAKKFILDGMQAAGILPKDDNRYINSLHDAFVYGGKSGVLVRVEPAADIKKDPGGASSPGI